MDGEFKTKILATRVLAWKTWQLLVYCINIVYYTNDLIVDSYSRRKSDMAAFESKNLSKSLSIASCPKSDGRKPLLQLGSSKQWKIGKGTGSQVALFIVKTIALEAVRRFSRARNLYLWTGLQGLQAFCYPPLKWVQRWHFFGLFVKGMQMLSRPLLILSIVDALSDYPYFSNSVIEDTDNSNTNDDSQVVSDSHVGSSSTLCNQDTGIAVEVTQGQLSTEWFCNLCEALDIRGISLPERIDKEELQRFYVAANGDLPSLLLAVQKTIRWRETYKILSVEELEVWSDMIFWHVSDVKHRPCLIIRLGMACVSLMSPDRPQFVQALVSQVEHGVLYLMDGENSQLTVIVDCQGLSPLKIPMKMIKHCCNILQDHFPNVLGCLIIIRLPAVVRVIAQTFIQVLKPVTRQKLRIEGVAYQKVLGDYFETLPSYLGGQCACERCAKLDAGSTPPSFDNHTSTSEAVVEIDNSDDFSVMDSHCSRTLRSAVVGILIIWALIAFIEGIIDPASRPVLLP